MLTWKKLNIVFDENSIADNSVESKDTPSIDTTCPKCINSKKNKTSKTLHLDFAENSWFCKHCGWSGNLVAGERTNYNTDVNEYNQTLKNFDNNYQLKESVLEKFKQKKISINTLNTLNIGQKKVYFPQLENDVACIIFPYFMGGKLVNIAYSHADKRHSEFGGKKICYGYDDIDEEETYVVLDEFEKMTFTEAGITNCISLFGENEDPKNVIKNLEFLSNIEDKLNKVKRFTLAMPSTEYGKLVNAELIRRLGKARCWAIFPPEENYNWSKLYLDCSKEQFSQILKQARPIPVKGIFELDDVDEAFENLYLYGLRKGAKTGFEDVDPYYTVIPGQWTLVTGIPGHGKSNFLDALLVNLANNEDWRFGIFSPENQPIQRHFAAIMEKKLHKSFNFGEGPRISPEEKDATKSWINRHFSVILPDEEDNWSIDGILDLAKVLVYRKGIKGLVIDPWNEIDHSRKNNKSETEYISECLTKIRRFAANYDVHVWIVAHPTKMQKDQYGRYLVPTPYDVAGSSHFRNKADNAISVWRNADGKDWDIVDIYIQKIRFKEVGKVGTISMRYDYKTGKYHQDVDQAKRLKCIQNNEHLESSNYLRKNVRNHNSGNMFTPKSRYSLDVPDSEAFEL